MSPTSTPPPTIPSPSPTSSPLINQLGRPQQPTITSPAPEGVQGIAATDVHMEASGFFDPDGDLPRESEWEIWDVNRNVRVWRGTGEGAGFSHVHLANGITEDALAGMQRLDFDRLYRLRVRYRDDSEKPDKEWSEWSEWRQFRTAPFGISPLTAAGVAADPLPRWVDETGRAIDLPRDVVIMARKTQQSAEEAFRTMMTLEAESLAFDTLAGEDGVVQLVFESSGSEPIQLPESRIVLTLLTSSGERREATIYLPAATLAAVGVERYWTSSSGATFLARPDEHLPMLSRPARETGAAWVTAPGYVVEEVAGGFTFPTQVILASESMLPPGKPMLLVMELKGRIWAVDSIGEKWIYADDLIDFGSAAPSSSSGQLGLGGMALHPESGQLFLTRTYRAPAPPIRWRLVEEPSGWNVYLPSTAAWSDGARKTKVVRYHDIPADTASWSFQARVEYERVDGVQRWTGGSAFGVVAYRDANDAVFFNFQSNRHLVELLVNNRRTLEAERQTSILAGWLRLEYAAGEMTFLYKGDRDQEWSVVERIDEFPFVPTRVGINGRNFGTAVSTATFTDIEMDGSLVEVASLLDDTDETSATWLHNQVVRLTPSADGRTAGDLEVVLDMPDDNSRESHQIQDIDVALDGTLFVAVGDGFDIPKSRDLTTFLGKILRINPDGSAPLDNPFYDPEQPRAPISYIYNYGIRNTYGMVVRRSDGRLFCSENGPSRDRIYSPEAGWDMGYDGSDRSILTHALWTWAPAVAPVGIEVMQTDAFPHLRDWIFVALAGQDFTTGISRTGKRIQLLQVDAQGTLTAGPEDLVHYQGSAKATVIGLAFAGDGLYFTTLYNTDPAGNPLADACLMRVRWVGLDEGAFVGPRTRVNTPVD